MFKFCHAVVHHCSNVVRVTMQKCLVWLLKCIIGLQPGIQVTSLKASVIGQLQVHAKDYPSIA